MVEDALLKNIKSDGILTNFGRINQAVTDFIRGNPIVSTALIGIGTTGLVIGAKSIITRRRKAKKRKATRRKATTTKKRRKKRTGVKRRIIRGRGLGRGEIKHSGKGTRGTKLVSFRTASGKLVRFKVKGTSKRRKGFVRKRRK